ncbi:MAG: HupE/UreJ family protein, partial [Synechococcus sp.]
MEELSLSPIQGFLSGVGHPLLGPDHFLFLVALMLVGWDQPRRWIPTLLAVGLLGSALAQVVVIPEALVLPTEALVSLSLVVEGLVILGTLSTGWLYP